MNNLATELKSLYSKQGNKILFNEKLSLNEVAFQIWEKLGYKNFDVSTLSRIINGKRLFTSEQLDIFANVLNISESKRKDLQEALNIDLLSRYGITQTISISDNTLQELNSSMFEHIHEVRERGLLSTTVDWSDQLINNLRIQLTKTNSNPTQVKLQILLAKSLYEKSFALECILPAQKNLSAVRDLVKEQLVIANKTKQKELAAQAYLILALAYYGLGNYLKTGNARSYYDESIKITRKVLSISSDPLSRLMAWRYLVLNSTYTQDEQLFTTAEKNMLPLIDEVGASNYIPWVTDSLARGKAHFKNDGAFKMLEMSAQYNKKLAWYDPLRETSMIRNEIDVITNIGTKENDYILKRALEGYNLSKKHGIIRYQSFFENTMQKIS